MIRDSRIVPQGELCSCGDPLHDDGICPNYPDYPRGEHPTVDRMPAIWTCPTDLNPDHAKAVNAMETEITS